MKIAVTLNEQGNIIDVNNTSENAARKQSKDPAWLLVEDNPSFTLDDRFSWTVRSSDNNLVHISTGMTPDEENQDNITELTKGNLANQMTGVQLQAAVTALTKSNLQLTLDNTQLKTDRDKLQSDSTTQQSAITSLTTEIMDLKLQETTK